MKKIVIILFVALVFSIPVAVRAAIEVTPKIIDVKAKARDKLDYTITIKNTGDKFISLYTFVNDINIDEGMQEFTEPQALDKTTSLARWISIPRGVIDLQPGAEDTENLTINVNMDAIPGERHAAITFSPGSNRYDAEDISNQPGQTQTVVNLEVEDDIIEKAQLVSFNTDKSLYLGPPVDFSATIKNIGNNEIVPQGFIYFYNRRGEEIDKIPINTDAAKIMPDSDTVLTNSWNGGQGLGKYRAKLAIEYGQNDLRDLQDTIYFWIVPTRWIITVGVGTFLLILLLAILLFRKTYHHQYQPAPKGDGVIDLKK